MIGGTLGFCGDSLAQCIEQRTSSSQWDASRAGRFSAYRMMTTIPYIGWVQVLERLSALLPSRRAVVAKVALDCFVYTPAVQSCFYMWMACSEGLSLSASFERVCTMVPVSVPASWIFWVPCQILNFALVPVAMRVNVVNALNVVWLAALSGFYERARGSLHQSDEQNAPAELTARNARTTRLALTLSK